MLDHVVLSVCHYEKTKAFYLKALARIREKYHPNYYSAFVLDTSGHNIEVVCHEPE